MGFESTPPPSKREVLEKALLGAAALASANSLQAESLPQNNAPTHEISGSYTETDSPSSVSEGMLDVDNADVEEIDSVEELEPEEATEKWINWKEVPTPASTIDSINESERQNLQQNIELLRDYAKTDSEEHSASLIIRPDGTTKWFDNVIVARESFSYEGSSGQLIVTEDTDAEIEKEIAQGATRIRIHNHPTAVSEGNTPPELARDLPPSPVDMFSLLSAPTGVSEGRVVTESGEWRYGFKNEEAKNAFMEAIETGSEDLDRLEDPKLMLQVETLMEAFAGKLNEQNQPKELLDRVYEFSKNHENLKEQIQGNYQFFASVVGMVSEHGLFTKVELEELGIQEVADLINSVDSKRSEALGKMDGLPVSSPELLAPPSGHDKDHSSYIDQWQRLGAYIERVSPVQK